VHLIVDRESARILEVLQELKRRLDEKYGAPTDSNTCDGEDIESASGGELADEIEKPLPGHKRRRPTWKLTKPKRAICTKKRDTRSVIHPFTRREYDALENDGGDCRFHEGMIPIIYHDLIADKQARQD
jgi:hypothetical protein